MNVKTQILLMDHLPSINCVFSLVQQQERQLAGRELVESKSIIMLEIDFLKGLKCTREKSLGTKWGLTVNQIKMIQEIK